MGPRGPAQQPAAGDGGPKDVVNELLSWERSDVMMIHQIKTEYFTGNFRVRFRPIRCLVVEAGRQCLASFRP